MAGFEVIDTLTGKVVKTFEPGKSHSAHGVHAAR
jgi:hypothetical protein